MVDTLEFRAPSRHDEPAWHALWKAYLIETGDLLTDDTATAATWARLLDPTAAVIGRFGFYNGEMVSFALFIEHESTASPLPTGFLEDLFVRADHRRRGFARAHLNDGRALAANRHWVDLYWDARNDHPARPLYKSMGEQISFLRFRMPLESRELYAHSDVTKHV